MHSRFFPQEYVRYKESIISEGDSEQNSNFQWLRITWGGCKVTSH